MIPDVGDLIKWVGYLGVDLKIGVALVIYPDGAAVAAGGVVGGGVYLNRYAVDYVD